MKNKKRRKKTSGRPRVIDSFKETMMKPGEAKVVQEDQVESLLRWNTMPMVNALELGRWDGTVS